MKNAPVAKLVYAADFKSVVHRTCGFGSHRGHHSYYPIFLIYSLLPIGPQLPF